MEALKNNKWFRAAIPALLLHCSIGTVYCWSIFSQEIADYIGFSKGATEWAFSFAIFSSTRHLPTHNYLIYYTSAHRQFQYNQCKKQEASLPA